MKRLRFLVESPKRYDFLVATLVQGLKNLGHEVYGWKACRQNYLDPHINQPFDVFIQTSVRRSSRQRINKPKVLLYGADTGTDRISLYEAPTPHLADVDIVFLRDYRGGVKGKVFPMNFGIEDRYYCCTDQAIKPLAERRFDLIFMGRRDCPGRDAFLTELTRLLPTTYEYIIGGHWYTTPDGVWSNVVSGHCTHCNGYYTILSDAKIVLSPMGAGPDCGRHWEAFASGGVPLIEFMPTVMVPPRPRDGMDCCYFKDARECASIVDHLLRNLDEAQRIADTGFATGKKHHTTTARARYFLEVLESEGFIK